VDAAIRTGFVAGDRTCGHGPLARKSEGIVLPFIVTGVTMGAVYGLAGGLVLTYKMSGIFKFAYGSIAAVARSRRSVRDTPGRARHGTREAGLSAHLRDGLRAPHL
jgi:hypothetical protein